MHLTTFECALSFKKRLKDFEVEFWNLEESLNEKFSLMFLYVIGFSKTALTILTSSLVEIDLANWSVISVIIRFHLNNSSIHQCGPNSESESRT